VMIEEEIFGSNRVNRNSTSTTGHATGASPAPATGGRRGEDWAVILSADITPFKGLDIKPLYSYVYIYDSVSTAVRKAVNNQQGAVAPTNEHRHTVGVDARWRSGPFSFDPTLMFQFGDRDQKVIGVGELETDIRAFIVDLQGGFQLGPLLLEARGVYTTGNKAKEDLRTSDLNYFQPLDLDTGYWAGWSAIQALGIDYFNGGATFGGGNPGTSIGYDRYGRMGFALRATYSLTPELAFYGIASPTWTAEKVDTDTTSGAIRGAPAAATNGGDSRYLGTEVDLGTTWRFAPNTVFDLQGAYYFAGSALDTLDASGSRDAKNGYTIAARIRMSF
jgi:Alginate export